MGWESVILPRLVSLSNGETVPYAENLAVGLDAPGNEMSRNHVGMAVAGEALRAWRAKQAKADLPGRSTWGPASSNLTAYLRDELTNGLWGGEVLCPTPHDAFHLAIAMFARLAAVESQDPELLRLTAEHCSALGRLCATLSDPTSEFLSAGVRVPLAKDGKEQKRPVHSALTEWWRYVQGKPNRVVKLSSDPMYVGLRVLAASVHDLLEWKSQSPGPVTLSRPVIVHRWNGGHQVEIPRRGTETGLTKGSKNPNGTCDWVRVEYGTGEQGKSELTFGMLWQTPPPQSPELAVELRFGGPQ